MKLFLISPDWPILFQINLVTILIFLKYFGNCIQVLNFSMKLAEWNAILILGKIIILNILERTYSLIISRCSK